WPKRFALGRYVVNDMHSGQVVSTVNADELPSRPEQRRRPVDVEHYSLRSRWHLYDRRRCCTIGPYGPHPIARFRLNLLGRPEVVGPEVVNRAGNGGRVPEERIP